MKKLIAYNSIDTMEDIFHKINNLRAEDLQEIANELLQKNQMSTLIYQSK